MSNLIPPPPKRDWCIVWIESALKWVVRALALLTAAIVFWSFLDILYSTFVIYQGMVWTIINIEEFLKLFGGVLVVLIGIEIFLNIALYLEKGVDHLRLVLSTALMAAARKAIIIDYQNATPVYLAGLGAVIVALGVTYWLVYHAHDNQRS